MSWLTERGVLVIHRSIKNSHLNVQDDYGAMRHFIVLTTLGTLFFLFTHDGCFLVSEAAECEDLIEKVERLVLVEEFCSDVISVRVHHIRPC